MKIELNVSEYSQLQLSIIDSRIEYENRLSLFSPELDEHKQVIANIKKSIANLDAIEKKLTQAFLQESIDS